MQILKKGTGLVPCVVGLRGGDVKVKVRSGCPEHQEERPSRDMEVCLMLRAVTSHAKSPRMSDHTTMPWTQHDVVKSRSARS
jgi:hypothetical protein